MHDDMSAKPCENCNMIMVNYADLWIVHTQVASQLKGAKLELKELKTRSLLLDACTSCDRDRFKERSWDGPIFTVVGFATKIICCKQRVSSFIPDKGVVATK
jgi:hypothetical protein